LTSTSIDPHTASTPALFDEEELMFDAIQNPVKARKEKDIGKVRAYVRVITSLGGSLNLELYCEKVSPTLPPLHIMPTPTPGPKNLL
jgi:peptidyl-prolyl cis-trans isomerase-like 2